MHDNRDGLLVERSLIGGCSSIEPCFVVGVARQYDFNVLAWFTHDTAVVAIAPLADRIGHGQAVGKTRRQFPRYEARPVGFTDADMLTDIAAEQQFGDRPRLLAAMAGQRFRLRAAAARGCGQRDSAEDRKDSAAYGAHVVASDFLGREKLIAMSHQMIAFRGGRAKNPKDHRVHGAEQAAQDKGLHLLNPLVILKFRLAPGPFPFVRERRCARRWKLQALRAGNAIWRRPARSNLPAVWIIYSLAASAFCQPDSPPVGALVAVQPGAAGEAVAALDAPLRVPEPAAVAPVAAQPDAAGAALDAPVREPELAGELAVVEEAAEAPA